MSDDPHIRRMRRDELDLAVEWAAREGWNPGLHDADAFWAQDPEGFWIATVDEEPAATISIATYDPSFAFLGFYIAAPGHRGKGIGKALWDAAIEACPARSIGLDGVIDQQANYRRSGFELLHRNVRFEGAVAGRASPDVEAFDPADTDALLAFDRAVFGHERAAFLHAWTTLPGHRTAVARGADGLLGYAIVRPCRSGSKVGPLFAADAGTARDLLVTLAAGAAMPLVLDVPEPNAAAMTLARDAGMRPTFETARMVRGPEPAGDLARTFGVTTFELG